MGLHTVDCRLSTVDQFFSASGMFDSAAPGGQDLGLVMSIQQRPARLTLLIHGVIYVALLALCAAGLGRVLATHHDMHLELEHSINTMSSPHPSYHMLKAEHIFHFVELEGGVRYAGDGKGICM